MSEAPFLNVNLQPFLFLTLKFAGKYFLNEFIVLSCPQFPCFIL
jgi:hypothetical protein